MKRWTLSTAFACAVTCVAALSAQANTDLIISEYVEGSSNNKAIELWNRTGAPIDLAAGGYKIQMYFNGAATVGGTVVLSGIVADNDAFVVTHSSAGAALLALADQTSGSLLFNGDDAVVLVKSAANTTVDAFGQVGNDPGTEWGTGLQSTADNTLRRKPTVCDGDLVANDPFDPSIQWDGFATDTFSGLGTHSDACGPTPVTPVTWGTIKSVYR